MARYAEFSAQNMAEIISWTKAFLQTGGWTIHDNVINQDYNYTQWSASKNGITHVFCAVYDGYYPYTYVINSGYYYEDWFCPPSYGTSSLTKYKASIGIKSAAYTRGDYFVITTDTEFPCKVFIFETSDLSVLISIEIAPKKYNHVYSGFINKSLTGAFDGGAIMSGSAFPIEKRTLCHGSGFFNIVSETKGPYGSGGCSSLVIANGIIYTNSDYYAKKIPRSYDIQFFHINNDKTLDSRGNLLRSIGTTKLIGLPSLYPYVIPFGGIYGGYLSDMWVCPMQTCQPGEELWMGVQKYITLPQCSYDPTMLGFAVRVN